MNFIIQRRGPHTIFMNDQYEVARVIGTDNYTDTFEEENEGVYRWTRTGPAIDRMIMEVRTGFESAFTIVPGVNYNGNGWGTFCEFVGDRYDGQPWHYGWHRVSAPVMTCSEGLLGGITVSTALFGQDNDGNCCSLFTEEGQAIHRICWPEEESPRTLRHYRYDKPCYCTMEPRSVFTAWLVLDKGCTERQGYRLALDTAWQQSNHCRPLPMNPEETWDRGVAFAKLLYTEEPDGFAGFNIGFAWEDGQWKKRITNKYEIGWCGQNAMLANALLAEALRSGDEEAKQMGLSVLDSWILYAHLPINVLHSYYDPGQVRYLEACNLGTAGIAYFEAYDLAGKLGLRRERYLTAALEICDFALAKQRSDGCLAKCWNDDGTISIAEGTVGSFLVMPLAEAYKRTGHAKYLEAAKNIYRFYFNELKNQGFTTAGALDIFSIDKESSIPLLKGAVMLHEISGEAEWLESSRSAAWYLSTWQYTHTVNFPPESLLAQSGYDTCGGTIVSTVHQGIDSFALCYIPELYTLWLNTGEERWKDRARAIWYNGCQSVSDGTLVIDGKLRPKGSQDESFQATRQSTMGAPSQWLVAWPGSFRMEVLRRMRSLEGFEKFFQQ